MIRPTCTALPGAVGNTPLVRLQRMEPAGGGRLFAKIESMNPLGSIKDRVAVALVDAAEADGSLQPGGTIVEPTSGNTGIGLAFVSASRGYRLILTMPESMSVERRMLLAHLGAELVLTPAAEGMRGAVARAAALQSETPGAWMPDQFANPANPAMHRRTTGPEICQQCGGRIDALVAGVGTGGTISGAGAATCASRTRPCTWPRGAGRLAGALRRSPARTRSRASAQGLCHRISTAGCSARSSP